MASELRTEIWYSAETFRRDFLSIGDGEWDAKDNRIIRKLKIYQTIECKVSHTSYNRSPRSWIDEFLNYELFYIHTAYEIFPGNNPSLGRTQWASQGSQTSIGWKLQRNTLHFEWVQKEQPKRILLWRGTTKDERPSIMPNNPLAEPVSEDTT